MALTFGAAASDRVTLGAGLDNEQAFTALAWIYKTADTNGTRIWHKGAGNVKDFILQFGAGGNDFGLVVRRATTNGDSASVTGVLPDNEWSCVACTYDETDGPRLFKGSLTSAIAEVSYATRIVGSGVTDDDSGSAHIIGNDTTNTRAFPGRIARLAHFRRRMTLQEIIAWQFGAFTDADCDIYLELGYNGTGTQPNLTSLGNGINGIVTGATVADHVPLGLPYTHTAYVGSRNARVVNRRGTLYLPMLKLPSGIRRPRRPASSIPSTGQLFTLSLDGLITPAGALFTQTAKPLGGATTPAGELIKLATKPLGGSTAPAGALAKQTAKPLAGSVTPAGSVTRTTGKGLGGTITPAGAVAKTVSKQLGGSVTPGGSLTKLVAKVLGGGVSPSGTLALIKVVLLALAGSITPTGTLTRSTSKQLGGSVAPSGSVVKLVSKPLAGAVTPSGSLTKLVGKLLVGQISPAGGLRKLAGKLLAGVLTTVGTLITTSTGASSSPGPFDVGTPAQTGFDPGSPEPGFDPGTPTQGGFDPGSPL